MAEVRWMTKGEIMDIENQGKLYPLVSYYKDVLE